MFLFFTALSAALPAMDMPEKKVFTGTDLRQTQHVEIPPEKDFHLDLSLKSAQLIIEKSDDALIHITATGAESTLKNISYVNAYNRLSLQEETIASLQGGRAVSPLGGGRSDRMQMRVVFGAIKSKGSAANLSVHIPSFDSSIVTQQELAAAFDETTITDKLQFNEVILSKVRMKKGVLSQGTIVAGSVEQAGKLYGLGTVFKRGIASRPGCDHSLLNSPASSISKAAKVKLLLPTSTDMDNICLNIKAEESSIIKLRDIKVKQLMLNSSGSAKTTATNLTVKNMKLVAKERSEQKVSLTANASISNSSLTTEGYAEISLQGNHSLLTKFFESQGKDNSKINIQHLNILTIPSYFYLYGYSNIEMVGIVDQFGIFAQAHSSLQLTSSDDAPARLNSNPLLVKDDYYSKAEISDYAKVSIEGWFNKIMIDQKGHGEFIHSQAENMEALIVHAKNYSTFNTQATIERARIEARDHATINVYKVIDQLDDSKRDYAKIHVIYKPGKEPFKF
ncbi:hypothetical protein [Candidatus Odyssella thessalonicensis]|uniref:hypothetical protein n=1 Tax=Candidatus Odyssella thessalonicensis TaxID=84647 RepID=UPI000225AC49|nr:hypothetical protein [Candidatus Odyssella thessalonicensis]